MAIITIGGNLGAGKTTLAARLAAELGYEELYVGGIFREMADERGISIEEFYKAIKNEPGIDRAVDERQAKLMREKDNLVIQGRVAWFFASHYLKHGPAPEATFEIVAQQNPFKVINVFLAVDPSIGARRVAGRRENIGKPLSEVIRATQERTLVERERYRTLYGIEDHFDPIRYDIVLDTSHVTADEVLKVVSQKILQST